MANKFSFAIGISGLSGLVRHGRKSIARHVHMLIAKAIFIGYILRKRVQ
jgi:hypothetical protein